MFRLTEVLKPRYTCTEQLFAWCSLYRLIAVGSKIPCHVDLKIHSCGQAGLGHCSPAPGARDIPGSTGTLPLVEHTCTLILPAAVAWLLSVGYASDLLGARGGR